MDRLRSLRGIGPERGVDGGNPSGSDWEGRKWCIWRGKSKKESQQAAGKIHTQTHPISLLKTEDQEKILNSVWGKRLRNRRQGDSEQLTSQKPETSRQQDGVPQVLKWGDTSGQTQILYPQDSPPEIKVRIPGSAQTCQDFTGIESRVWVQNEHRKRGRALQVQPHREICWRADPRPSQLHLLRLWPRGLHPPPVGHLHADSGELLRPRE